MTRLPLAKVDRLVVQRGLDQDQSRHARVSEIAGQSRWVLFGEPGSGKSATLRQAAEAAGTSTVTAREFVEGQRPRGRTVFIDAFEEYRMGEPSRDRLADLSAVLRSSNYDGWRIACRSISLPASEVRFLEGRLLSFSLWQLEPLTSPDIKAVLEHFGEADPTGFVRRIERMATGSLMGNPATLRLLHETVSAHPGPILTRSGLFAAATRKMAHELNKDMPDNPGRPGPASILGAAEVACLVLLLSARSELWSLDKLPDHACVTLDDLIPAGVSTNALRHALDTPMFRGEGGAFIPTHRIVAEYLGGQALARAVDPDPTDGALSALPVARAVALLCGDGARPAPALTGLHAWFVTALASTRYHREAMMLLREDPETILFHGDAAALPEEHRRELLRVVGRADPWFLGSSRGSSALAGLAGDDLAEDLAAVIFSPNEEFQRRTMALMALATGRRVPALSSRLFAFAADASTPEPLRKLAADACLHLAEDSLAMGREILVAISSQVAGGPLMLRLHLLAPLVGAGAEASELRRVLADYAASVEEVMGYARQMGVALVAAPMPTLFDEPILGGGGRRIRYIEVRTLLDDALAAAIVAVPDLKPERLLAWIRNVHGPYVTQLRKEVREAIVSWMAREPPYEVMLFDALAASLPSSRRIAAGVEFHRIVGRFLSTAAKAVFVERLEQLGHASPEDFREASEIAGVLTARADDCAGLFERVVAAVCARGEEFSGTLAWLLAPVDDKWRSEHEATMAEQRRELARQQAEDRDWVAANRLLVQSGRHIASLAFGARVVFGEQPGDVEVQAGDPLSAWVGVAGAADIRAGWEAVATDFPLSPVVQEGIARRSVIPPEGWIAAAHAAETIRPGLSGPMPIPYAFAVVGWSFLIKDAPTRDMAGEAAADRIILTEDGRQALLEFWVAAAGGRARELPYLRDFESRGTAVAGILIAMLECRPSTRACILQQVLEAALRCVPCGQLLDVARKALSRRLPPHARRLWTFAAFLLEPGTHRAGFAEEIDSPESHASFGGLFNVAGHANISMSAEAAIERDAASLQHLGPLHPPPARYGEGSMIGQCLGEAVERISRSPLEIARNRLQLLSEESALQRWRELLRHSIVQQENTRREALFTAPIPRDVAKALNSGPPAVPADLRAVVRDLLAALAMEIRDGQTSGWRAFWNRPPGGAKTAKVENECRDILADRLSDRLAPFKIPVTRPVLTEARSGNDRRADMVVLGKGDAAVPVEVKRHWNTELWTAPTEQLEPYARSLGASGHGIYLVLWFGSYKPVPGTPAGFGPIDSAESLHSALVAQLPPEKRARLDVVVVDVSDQETVTSTRMAGIKPGPSGTKARAARTEAR